MYEFHSYAAFNECAQEVTDNGVAIHTEITVKHDGKYESHTVAVPLPSAVNVNDTPAVIDAMEVAMPKAITNLIEKLNNEST